VVSGTPLVMLEESFAATQRRNANRTKPIRFDFQYYFIDVEQAHTDYLRRTLDERGYPVEGGNIIVRTIEFEEALDGIIAAISRHLPRSGRSIFLLDQCGYSEVRLESIEKIFQRLSAAEVILTFAADSLVNHFSDKAEYVRDIPQLGLTKSDVLEFIALNYGAGGRALLQRRLRDKIISHTGATFDTPFFIRPRQSRRALWFLHLSRHPTARDVMIQCHWNASNIFEHYGRGDFGMLGWDALRGDNLPLFNFKEHEADALQNQLLRSMPSELLKLASKEPPTLSSMHSSFANDTAARFADLDAVVLQLFKAKELDILNSDGKIRSRSINKLQPTDRIAVPRMPLLPGLFRK
jgi:three-Cys-motif partner protein